MSRMFRVASQAASLEILRGARVVVTGCSTGVGEQVAYQYARLGAKVVITARREERLREVVAKMKDLGAQEAIYVAGDIISGPSCICPGCS
ncbi:hydroxysteroid 11-beta-dehydrogenase 1-like protein isoform X2 [Branchiostoma floridae]|uniref:Hydroxysteroid 11-beta-dehydrogenase 1-like protein isoform X2 n=1 Tax=Branchiostoma floridae TaxID=7739 RepID=A0A9J7KUI4_BRAFL|nr:hydroxysteroid 11-beta-dehydrogenase 1-like protein isoform X2 [Branchiostoma floridae]